MTIASRAAECAQLFDRWLSSTQDELLRQEVENQIFRFNLWASNNAVFAPSRASMDWRLRSAPLLESTMVELLDDLHSSLIKQAAIRHHVTESQDQFIIQVIDETLDGLFRLSRAIRRSGILRRFVKVGNYVEHDENGANLTAAFREGADRIITFRFKEAKATDELRKRVIDTICLRQQHFSYLRAKSSRNAPVTKSNPSQLYTARSTLGATASITGSLSSKARRKIVNATAHLPRAGGPSIMTATTAQPARMARAYSVKSANDYKSNVVDSSDAELPPAPKATPNLKELECPYCFLVCSREELSGDRWRSHIIQDLMPYICVLESCITPNALFESAKDWLSHMRNQHTASGWTCMDNTHNTTLFFQSESGFRDHMGQYHADQFDDDDLDDIAAACYQRLPEDVMIRECPFCPGGQNADLDPPNMINHIAGHLISLAQISLAGHIDGGDSASEWSESKRFPSYDISQHSGPAGSLSGHLNDDFFDNIEEKGTEADATEFEASISGDDSDLYINADECDALWACIRKPAQDLQLDPKLRSFVARFNAERDSSDTGQPQQHETSPPLGTDHVGPRDDFDEGDSIIADANEAILENNSVEKYTNVQDNVPPSNSEIAQAQEDSKVGTNWKYGRCSIKTFKGHTNGVMCLQFEDNILATGSYDTTIKIWDTDTGEELRTLRGHESGIRCLQFDETKLISGSLDCTMKVWNWRTGECISTYIGHRGGVIGLHFDASILASGSVDKTVKIWNFEDKSTCLLRGHTDGVNAVRVDTQSRTLFSASDDCTIRLWDLDTKICIRIFQGHVGQVLQVVPLPREFEFKDHDAECENNNLSTTSGDTDPHSLQASMGLSPNATYNQSSAFGPGFRNGRAAPPRYMVTSALDSTIRLWETTTGQCLRTFFGHLEGVWALGADTLRIVSGAEDRMIKIWDPRTGKCERTFTSHSGPVTCIGLGDSRFATGSEDCEVRMYSF